jgi:hypothetical protein
MFARALVEGNVFPRLEQWKSDLLYEISLIDHQKIPLSHSKVFALVQPLIEKKIFNREQLEVQWQKEPRFLLSGYLTWVKSALHPVIKSCWPPVEGR